MFGDRLNVFEVGGCVRDKMMGFPPESIKDIDFSVECESFDQMESELTRLGFEIFKSDPEFVTCRARFPRGLEWGEWLLDREMKTNLTADFVLCRKDGVYSDGRRPDTVEIGTIHDDLARRDFTVNAMAEHPEAGLLDPHHGLDDCNRQILRFVGDPFRRIEEDGLRVLRGLRFMVTRDLSPTGYTGEMLHSALARQAVRVQHDERIFEELSKMFRHDTVRSLQVLDEYNMLSVVFPRDGMWLMPTMKER